MTDRTVRFGGAAAIIFVVLILISVFSAGQPPMADDAVDKIRTYFVDHRSAILFSNMLGLLSIPFVVWFTAVFREINHGDDRTTNALGTATLAAVAVTAPMALLGGALSAAPVYVDGMAATLSDDTLRVMYEAQTLAFAGTSAGLILFGLTAALAVRRSGVLPVYVMALGLLMAVGNLVVIFSVLGAGSAALGLPGVLTFALFLLVTGITMAAGKTKMVSAGV